MKKLALALVCFASVAFFASCTPEVTNPEPSISVITDNGFVQNNDVVDLGQVFVYGFQMASNSQTQKELKQLSVATSIFDLDGNEEPLPEEIVSLAGMTEYRYIDTIKYTLRDVIGTVRYIATVTDVDGKINTTTLTLTINQPALPLEAVDFSWNRHGAAAVTGGIEEVGLKWTSNGKEDFAIIKPMDGATLYQFMPTTWDEVTTNVEKAAAFEEALSISDFRGVSAWSTNNYDFVIGTIYNGEQHLIHITRGEVFTFKGTDITIKGQIK